ncbi:SDR family oxidoreductase [Kallotenue papyrolyticum]|uniref:SDR family oxidoreductase n=1 Tax=Kallotenue papyrolyticum TaxID=1325125 RepID=UPI0004785598|nr:SDR family NAD(P)-dependent oxidoreductase [Kallotenue papyrolyticum]
MQLEGKVALITGAGSGIGKAAALLFAREGARVAALSHTEDEVQQTAREIEAQGGAALAVVADVADAEQMQRAVAHVVSRWQTIDIVFANAGINGVWAPLEELQPEEWDRTINTNLRGTFLTVKYAVPYLKRQGGAVIITSSINGTRVFSNTGATAYSCTKAAQVAFAKMVAVELAEHGVRVNVICPGAIETSISENTEQRNLEQVRPRVEIEHDGLLLTHGKPGAAEDVARLALFLASDAARHITGTEIWIDGVQSLVRG